MSASKVYFTNLRAKPSQNLLKKLEALVIKAGIDKIDFEKKIVAIKIHFGEPGNLAYLRPNYAARIVKMLKSKRGNSISYRLQYTLLRKTIKCSHRILKQLLKTGIILLQQIVL